jgi:cell division septation protein DedD
MAHEIHDDGFHEIQLSGKQLVFLFMATTVVSIVIFLCGVLVGRGVQQARGSVTDDTTTESLAEASPDETAAAPTSGKPTNVEGLTYAGNLQSQTTPAAEVQAGAAADLRQTVDAPPAATVEAAAPAPAPPVTPAAKEATPPRQEAPLPPTQAPAPAAAAPAGDGGFTVQVTALKNRPEADAIANRLQARGYKAYVVAPAGGGQVIYKVRVGMDMQRADAEKVMRRLQSEEKFKPWITR